MFRRTKAKCFAQVVIFLCCFGISLFGQTEVASLRLRQELRWQRVSPSSEQPDGPVLYQLLFSMGGTPGTVPAFDTNPRHLVNSPIVVNGGNVVIGGASASTGGSGLIINGVTGILNFAAGQTFPGTGSGSVTSVATGAGLTGGPITTTGTVSIPDAGITNNMLAPNSRIVVSKSTNVGSVQFGSSCTNSGGTITITAPAGVAGKVLVRADASFSISHTLNNGTFWQIFIGTSPTTCDDSATGAIKAGIADSLPTDVYSTTMSISGLFSVAAGSTTTFYLNAKTPSFFYPAVNVVSGAMDAIFVPQ
jgi:hypothetical protein